MAIDTADWTSAVNVAAVTTLGTITTVSANVEVLVNYNIPVGTRALGIQISAPTNATRIRVYDSGANFFLNQRTFIAAPYLNGQGAVLVPLPVNPVGGKLNVGYQDNVGGQSITVVAHNQATPDLVSAFPLPWIAPNKPPLFAGSAALANATAAWLIAPQSGVGGNLQIWIFDIVTTFINPAAGSALYYVGHDTVLPVATPAAAKTLFKSGNTGAFLYPQRGAPLPAGEGIWIWNGGTAALENWHELLYSLN